MKKGRKMPEITYEDVRQIEKDYLHQLKDSYPTYDYTMYVWNLAVQKTRRDDELAIDR